MDPRSGRVYMLYPYNPAPGGTLPTQVLPCKSFVQQMLETPDGAR